jgi:SAM-dependent methyltransferase
MRNYFLYAIKNYGSEISVWLDNSAIKLTLRGGLFDHKGAYLYQLTVVNELGAVPPRTLEILGENYIRRMDAVYMAQFCVSPNYLRAVYDDLSDRYDSLVDKSLHEVLYTEIFGVLTRAKANLRVLDLGCGLGVGGLVNAGISSRLNTVSLYGCDISLQMLKHLPPMSKTRYEAVCLVDGNSVPFQSGSFDCILLVFVAHYLSRTTIDDVFRILRPGGKIIMNVYKYSTYHCKYVDLMYHPKAETVTWMDTNTIGDSTRGGSAALLTIASRETAKKAGV